MLLIFGKSYLFSQELDASGIDSLSTEEITVEANRLKMTKLFAPNKIQVISGKMLAAINGNRLADALEIGDAVFVRDYGFNSGLKTVSLNSTQSEHTLILLDGVRLNSRQNAQVDLSLYDISDVSRIEISKGGSSALYGSEAIGGVINIITGRTMLLNSYKAVLKSNIGSYGFRKFSGRFSKDLKLKSNSILQVDINAGDERAKNNFEYYYQNGNTLDLNTRENNDYNAQNADVNVKLVKDELSVLNFTAHYTRFDRGLPGVDAGYSPGTAMQIDNNAIASVVYNKKFSKLISLNSSASYSYQLEKYFDTATYNLAVVLNSFYKLNSYSNNSSVNIAFDKHNGLETGYELNYSSINSNEVETAKVTNASYYIAGKTVFTVLNKSKLTLYPDIRYDYYSNIKDRNVVTGKLGLNFKQFCDIDYSLKMSIGNSFRAPTFNELYWKTLGNPDLKPERSVNLDAGLIYIFNTGFRNEFEFSYFFTRTTDRIIWQPVSGILWSPLNVGIVNAEGVDISLKSSFSGHSKLSGNINFGYNYGTATKKNEDYAGDPSYNKQLIYLPKEAVKSSIMLLYLPTSKIIKFVSFNLFYKHISRRYSNFENTEFVPGYGTFDCNAGIGFGMNRLRIDMKLMVNNVLNEDYKVVPGYPMPLRNFKLELDFKY